MTETPLATSQSAEVSRRTKVCRACNSPDLEYVLDLGNLMLSDFVTRASTIPIPRVQLRLVCCRTCELLQLSETTDPDLLYRHFWYRTGINQTMRKEMSRLIHLGLAAGRESGCWLDIGANDGTLLGMLDKSQWFRVGYEPAKNLTADLANNCDIAVDEYYPSAWGAGYKFDVITSAAMFYDLDDPHPFLDKIREDLADGGVWINQLSYTPDMVRTLAFDNICHEHLCYYNVTTLQRLLGIHGLRIHHVEFNDINGGSMCCQVVHQHDPRETMMSVTQASINERHHDANYYRDFGRKVTAWREMARARITELRKQGLKLHVYGASTKGNTLLQFCEFGPEDFKAAADRNPHKWGKQTAGSWIPIVSEEMSRADHPDAYFVLPWAFKDEFVKREAQYLANGGTLIFPLPSWTEVRA